MCGIVAVYNSNKFNFHPKELEAMTNELEHRGPDDFSYAFVGNDKQIMWRDETPEPIFSAGIALGHRRLSILDLTVAGRQPYISKDKRYWMVYNGEVYNYLELRSELEKLGFTFSTSTDTEVVLNAYIAWGNDFLSRLNGMFSIIIWDNKKGKFFAARDRIGIKPLFYCELNGLWIFASEIKAILKHPKVEALPRKEAIFDFLWAGKDASNNLTFFKNIKSLDPATFIEIENGKAKIKNYWELPEKHETEGFNQKEKSDYFLDLLTDSVRLRLRSDVRVGTMLSGGLDSTGLATVINLLLKKHAKEVSSVKDTHFALFASYPNLWNDETDTVEELSSKLNIHVEKVYPIEADLQDIFYQVLYAVEEPFVGNMPYVQHLYIEF